MSASYPAGCRRGIVPSDVTSRMRRVTAHRNQCIALANAHFALVFGAAAGRRRAPEELEAEWVGSERYVKCSEMELVVVRCSDM